MRFDKHLWYILLIFVAIFVLRNILFSPGIAWKGDYVPVTPTFAYYTFFTWSANEQAGYPNLSFLFHFPLFALQAIFSFLLGIEIASKLYLLFTLALISVCMFAALDRLNQGKNKLSSLLGGMIYMLNPWAASRILSGHLPLLIGYAITPLYVVALIETMKQKQRRSTLKPALLLGLIFIAVYHAAILVMMISGIYVLYSILVLRRGLSYCVSRFSVIVAIALLLNSFWIFPFAFIQQNSPTQLVLVKSNVQDLSKNAVSVNVVRLLGYWWTPYSHDMYISDISLFDTLWLLFSFALPFLTLLSFFLALKHRRENDLYFFLLLPIALILSHGTQLLGDYYVQLLSLPFMAVLRDPDKFCFLVALFYSFILGQFFDKIVASIRNLVHSIPVRGMRIKMPRLDLVLVLSLVAIIFIGNWVWFTGDFNGYFKTAIPPKSYDDANRWLSAQNSDFRVLWFPTSGYLSFSWYPDGVLEPQRFIISKPILNPERGLIDDLSPDTTYFIKSVQNALYYNLTRRIGGVLGLANVRYVALRTDTQPEDFPKHMLDSLLKQVDLRLVWQEDPIYIFENMEWLPRIRSANTAIMVAGGMYSLHHFLYMGGDFNNKVFFFPEQLEYRDIGLLANWTDSLFMRLTQFQDWVLAFTPRDYWIDASQYATWSDDYQNYWVKGSILQRNDTGDLSYGRTVASTSGNQAMVIPFSVKTPGKHYILLRIFGTDDLYDLKIDYVSVNAIFSPDSLRFRWVTFAEDLEKGLHLLQIIPKGKTVSLDKIVILPYGIFQESYEKALQTLGEKPFVYYLEGEDFSSGQANKDQFISSSANGLDFSMGLALHLNGSGDFGRNLLMIPEEGNYSLSIRAMSYAKGDDMNFRLSLLKENNETWTEFNFVIPTSEYPEWHNVGSVQLSSGQFMVRVWGDNITLDAMVITNSDDLLPNQDPSGANNETAQINRIDPTDYTIRLNSSSDKFIVFSESYNRLWSLKTENASSSPISSDIFSMSFRLNATQKDANLFYEPQVYASFGWAVSFLTVVMIVMFNIIFKMRVFAKRRSFGFCQQWSLPYVHENEGMVLDVGCGSCQLKNIIPSSMEYIGADISLSNLRLSKGTHRVRCDAQNLPFEDHCFSTIFAYEVLEHLPQPMKLMDEAKRTMKPDAIFVLSTPNNKSIWSKVFLNSKEHIQHFTPETLDNMLASRGFAKKVIPNGVVLPIVKKALKRLSNVLPVDMHEWCIRIAWIDNMNV